MAYQFKKESNGRVSVIDTNTNKKIQNLNPGCNVALSENRDKLLIGTAQAREFACDLDEVAGWTDAAGSTTTYTFGTTSTDSLLDALGGFFFS